MHHRLKGLAHLVAISLVTAFVISSAYLAGFVTQRIAETEARQLQTSDTRPFDVFWEAWEILHREFYGPLPDSNDTVYAAIQGAIDTLGDPYTAFANPRQAQLFEDSLNGGFEGIGATVEKRDGRIVIVAPLPNTPAERAGLRAGDVVLSVDGKSLLDVDLWEAIVRIRGPRGTSVTLTLLRSGQSDPIDVTLQRDRIEVPTVESRVIHQDGVTIAYVKLLRFASNAPRQFRDEIRRLMDENPQGVILDLRDNPGGYLYVAVRIASEFIDEGLILTEQGKDGQRPHPAEPGGLLSGSNALPLAVLVNKGSASASKIVAAPSKITIGGC